MKLTELFDTHFEFNLFNDTPYMSQYNFWISDDEQIAVSIALDEFKVNDKFYMAGDVAFIRGDENGNTIKGNNDHHGMVGGTDAKTVIKIISTLVEIIKECVSRHDIDIISFGAKSSEQSRVKTYRSLAKRMRGLSKFEFNDPNGYVYAEPSVVWVLSRQPDDITDAYIKTFNKDIEYKTL